MATISQIAANLDLNWMAGDELSLLLDADISFTGYTITAAVLHSDTTTAMTVANTDLSAGQVTLSLTDTQTTTIGKGYHSWYVKWTVGGVDRKIISGQFNLF